MENNDTTRIDPNTKVNQILDILEDVSSEHKKLTINYIDTQNSRFIDLNLFNRRMEKIFGYMKEIAEITNPDSIAFSTGEVGSHHSATPKKITSPEKKDMGYEEKILKIKAILLDPNLQSNQFIDEKARLILESLPHQNTKYFSHLSDTPDSISKGLSTIRTQLNELKVKMERVKLNNEGQGFSIKQPSVSKMMDELALIQDLLTQFTFNVDDVVSLSSSKQNALHPGFNETPNTNRSHNSTFTFMNSPMTPTTYISTGIPHNQLHNYNPRESIASTLPERLSMISTVGESALTLSLAGEAPTTSAYANSEDFLVVKYGHGLTLFKDGNEFFTSKPIYCKFFSF